MMHDAIQAQLPFYAADQLGTDERLQIERHLAVCADCRAELVGWYQLARAVQHEATSHLSPLPPLSPLVLASAPRAPSVSQAIGATWRLAWAQRRRTLGAVIIFLTLLALATFGSIQLSSPDFVGLPLVALMPAATVLLLLFAYHMEEDPAAEIMATMPLSLGTILLARATLLVGTVALLLLPASLIVSITRSGPLLPLVSAWLGPLLLLSTLATFLSLRWGTIPAAAITLSGWATVMLILSGELAAQRAILGVPLARLLQPDAPLFLIYLLMAGLLAILARQQARQHNLPLWG